MRVTNVLLLAATLAATGCRMARDQEARVGSNVLIGSEVSCPSCCIVIDSVVTLEGAYLSGPATTIERDPAGVFYLADPGEGLLRVYGSDGRFMRQVGRRGAGPGEFEMVRNTLVARDGSIRVLDGVLRRLSVFSRDGEFLGSRLVQVAGGIGMPAVLLPDDQLVVNARAITGAEAGSAVQLIDKEGNATSLFDEAPFDPRKRWLLRRLLWGRPNGEFLVARPYSFTIDVYASDHAKKLSITRVADWIPSQDPEEAPSDGLFDKPPTPQLTAIWEDAQGLLWLSMVAPSRSWRPGPPREQVTLSRETAYTLANRPRFETIIEVVDVERQGVLARSRLDGSVGTPFGGGYLALSVEDSVGEPGLRISRVQLNLTGGSKK
jgi:hypothetical protein